MELLSDRAERREPIAPPTSAASGCLLLFPHADRQDDDLDPHELEPALDRERGLVVQGAREEVLALEHELPREHHRPAELLGEIEAHALELLDQVGAEPV